MISLPTPQGFLSPADETTATKTFTAGNEDGLEMEIVLHGYKSESLGEEFYAKSNGYFSANVKITNMTDRMYQQTTSPCCCDDPLHNHKLIIDLSDENGHAIDLPADEQDELPMIAAGIALYEEDIYTNQELFFGHGLFPVRRFQRKQ